MKTKAIAIISLLFLAATVFATTACDPGEYGNKLKAADAWYAQEEYRKAGDCYNEAKAWDKCALSYLKAGRISEMKWYSDPAHSDIAFRSEAMLMYNSEYYDFSGLGSDMGLCVYNSGDTDLDSKLDDYHEWIEFYAARGGNPPFDMQALIDNMETKVFSSSAPEPIPVSTGSDITPKKTTTTTAETTTTTTPEPQGTDMTMILVIGAIVVAGIVGAVFFLKKKK
jgi:tetratricopeptide (TPR) repeat protein